MNPRRLYRSRRDRQLAGVAGGMAEYLEVDPTVVRLVWILSIFLGGFGILLYIIMAFIVPLDPRGMPGPGGGSWQAPGPSGTSPDGGGADAGVGPDGTALDVDGARRHGDAATGRLLRPRGRRRTSSPTPAAAAGASSSASCSSCSARSPSPTSSCPAGRLGVALGPGVPGGPRHRAPGGRGPPNDAPRRDRRAVPRPRPAPGPERPRRRPGPGAGPGRGRRVPPLPAPPGHLVRHAGDLPGVLGGALRVRARRRRLLVGRLAPLHRDRLRRDRPRHRGLPPGGARRATAGARSPTRGPSCPTRTAPTAPGSGICSSRSSSTSTAGGTWSTSSSRSR